MLKRLYFEGLFWLALSIFVCIKSIQLELGDLTSPGPGFMPFGMAMIMLFLSLLMFGKAYFSKAEVEQTLNLRIGSVAIVLFIIGYVIIFKTLGYILSGFLLWPLIFKFMGAKQWLLALVEGIAVTFLSYLVFGMFLGLNLPVGIFFF